MPRWTFKTYSLEGGTCPIRDWYKAQDPEVRAEFDATLIILKATEDWEEDTKHFRALEREHVGLGEIRFWVQGRTGKRQDYRKRRFRPVGIWPPIVDWEFILLAGCEKQRGILHPSDAFSKALYYKQQLEAGIGDTDEYW